MKKIRSATLVETMVASVIIVIVFLIASLSLNNIFRGTINSDDATLRNRINELTYFVSNEKVKVPFYEDTPLWDIAIETQEGENVMEVLNKKNRKEIRIKLAE
ncbi:hypothetical protein [Aequorivita sp. CIP111184]|uniref:hypothetical protein n=1 Tax=Aequorivita sp. CIP111184 TaxID=2211356 RepID=UPI0011BE88CD|nr:hypothetical protein [Aequorivita sp. CIP111184]